MKRSEINHILRESLDFLQRMHFLLPPFAHWTPDEWRTKGPECREIVEHQLGWDITDFGIGPFTEVGLFLFTVRNGKAATAAKGGKTYAEKIMIVRERQTTPLHFHKHKMEDIINRGGGDLVIQLYNSLPGPKPDLQSIVKVSIDGVERTLPAGSIVTLQPGESITLTQGLYHEFWGGPTKGWTMVGEVSQVNDDAGDNFFYRQVGRFPAIEEDEPPFRLLVSDYAHYYQPAAKA